MRHAKSNKSDPPNQTSVEEKRVPETTTEADLVRLETQSNTNAISRVLAVIVLMCIPGIAGHYLDKWFGTSYMIAAGFILGMGLAIVGLVYVSNLADKSAKETRELKKKLLAEKEKGLH